MILLSVLRTLAAPDPRTSGAAFLPAHASARASDGLPLPLLIGARARCWPSGVRPQPLGKRNKIGVLHETVDLLLVFP
jgi:hypothetical protein